MNRLIAAAICCLLMLLVSPAGYAISAQWDLDPISGDWNTAANWTPMGVPNGQADIATFGLSNTTDVSISANTEVNSIVFTPAATNPYTITASAGLTLTISGAGIINNSGVRHTFIIDDNGQIRFTNSSTAGNSILDNTFFPSSGQINFFDRSTAGTSEILGSVNFFDGSTAGDSNITDIFGGEVNFFDRSTAGSAVVFTKLGAINFFDSSTAGSAVIAGGGIFFRAISFFDNSTAGSATIFADSGSLQFANNSTAGSATIHVLGFGGLLSFEDSSQGGTARIELLFAAVLDISAHNAPGVTIGSIEGEGNVFLGGNNLTVGSNNLSTTFSGVIQDEGGGGGTGGSLTKIGSGTFILTGANTYTGDTNINGGVLQVDGSITSNTFVNQRGTLAGTGTINGNIVNNGRVIPGSAGTPGMLTVVGNYTQTQYATLMIQIAGMSAGDFSVLNVLGNANLNGFLDPVLLNGFVPTIGDSFTFLNYASLSGEFSHIKHRVFDNGMLQWSVIYEANSAILTVEQHVPDQGSTFLLLMLGLLGLVAYRRQLLRGRRIGLTR